MKTMDLMKLNNLYNQLKYFKQLFFICNKTHV